MSSLSRVLYTGVTNDIDRRVREHKACLERSRRKGQPGSFTARYNVKRLAYFEEFGEITEAIAREKKIKRMSRAGKIRLIESTNPNWDDLSADWD